MPYNQDQDYSDEISRFKYKYKVLWDKWEKAKGLVREHQKESDIESYDIIRFDRNDELRFRIFSIDCFMKFWPVIRKGRPSTGIIQYGIILEGSEIGRFKKKRIDLIEFYDKGVIKKPAGVPVMVGAFEEAPNLVKNVHAYMLCEIIMKYPAI